MNTERLTILAEQLERGAPGVAFCLGAPRSTIAQALGPDADPHDLPVIRRECAAKSLGRNDIACGLDGYALHLFAPDYPLSEQIFHDPHLQEASLRYALALLDLPWIDRGPRWDCGHPLFDPPQEAWTYAPKDAAQAVRRLLAGADPWPR